MGRRIMGPDETAHLALALKGSLNAGGLSDDDIASIIEDRERARAVAMAARDVIREVPGPREHFAP